MLKILLFNFPVDIGILDDIKKDLILFINFWELRNIKI